MGKINVYDKIMIANQNKRERKYGNQKNCYINLYLTDGLEMEFTACQVELMPESADIIYHM